jgi:hypothetical protein
MLESGVSEMRLILEILRESGGEIRERRAIGGVAMRAAVAATRRLLGVGSVVRPCEN